MRDSNNSIVKVIILSLVLPIMMTACFGSAGGKFATKYYLIEPVNYEALNLNDNDEDALAVEIIDVHLPQYLERFHIAIRIGESRIKFSESNQWAESLRKNLMRTMTRNLSQLLFTQDIGTPLKRSSSLPDYRMQIYIEQFEWDVDLKVKLSARWQISKSGSSEPLGIYSEKMVGQAIADNDYDKMVSSMRRLYGELSRKIAESIIIEENK